MNSKKYVWRYKSNRIKIKDKGSGGITLEWLEWCYFLQGRIRVLPETVTFEQRPLGHEEASCDHLAEEYSRPREQQVYKPYGRNTCDVFKNSKE